MDKEVSSRTFSIGAFEVSTGFEGTSVAPGMMGRQLSVWEKNTAIKSLLAMLE